MIFLHFRSDNAIDCRVHPSPGNLRNSILFLLLNIPLWFALIYYFQHSVVLPVIFLLEWLAMAFIALPLLICMVAITSAYMLLQLFSWQSLFFLAISWIFLFLIFHTTMRYNAASLKKWLIRNVAI